MTTRDLTNYRPATSHAEAMARVRGGGGRAPANAPREFPRGAVNDLFPLHVVPDQLVARTVFTSFKIDRRTIQDPHAAPLYGALCACGHKFYADNDAMLRSTLSAHSCVDERGRPIELVPLDGDPDTDTLRRVLFGLREMR